MKIAYNFQSAITEFKEEITSLTILNMASDFLQGKSPYVEGSPEIYNFYCQVNGYNFWDRIKYLSTKNVDVFDLEVFIKAPVSFLDVVIPAGVRLSNGIKTFRDFKDEGTNPVFTLPDGKIILRTNLFGTISTKEEVKIYLQSGYSLLYNTQVQALLVA